MCKINKKQTHWNVRRKNKRAMATSVLIILIISIFAGIMLILAATRLVLLTHEKTDVDVCRFSILINSKVKEAVFSSLLRRETPIQCIATPYKAEKEYDKYGDMNSIAKQLDECWYKMGEGNLAVFGEGFIFEQAHCIVCSEFTTNNNIDLNDLKQVIENRNSKYDRRKKLNAYLAYKANVFKIEDSVFDKNGERETNTIKKPEKDKENNYLVVFRRYSGAKLKPDVLFGENEFQRVFIVHEQGLSELKANKENPQLGYRCNQLLWEKRMD